MWLRDIDVPGSWAEAASRLVASCPGGPVLVLGAPDRGKSTLARYLVARLVESRGAAALLDGDLGMSTVGPPGVVGLTLVRDADALLTREWPDRAWFAGTTTPVRAVAATVLGHARLAALARSEGVPIVVNSAGLVHGRLAKDLQLDIADAVGAATAVGLAVGDELEGLLVPLGRPGVAVERLPISPRARLRLRPERALIREQRFARYLAAATGHDLRLDGFALEGTLLGSGRGLSEPVRREVARVLGAEILEAEQLGDTMHTVVATPPVEGAAAELLHHFGDLRVLVLVAPESSGLLLGLLDGEGDCRGLGLLAEWRGGGVLRVTTPLDPEVLAAVKRLRFGTLRVAANGAQIGGAPREIELGAPAV